MGAIPPRVATNPEMAAAKFDIVSVILDIHQPFQESVASDLLPGTNGYQHRFVVFLAANAVNARHAGHHNDIPPGKERTHRRKAHPFDLLVYAGVLLDKRIRAGDVSLRLVIIEIADEILDRVMREEALELGVELGRQSLVVGKNKDRLVEPGDDIRHSEGFPGPGHPKQRLMLQA